MFGYATPADQVKTVTTHGDGVTFTPAYSPVNTITLTLPGGVPMVMKMCPAGSFQMGRYSGERSSYSWEGPQHTVTIAQPFYIGQCEVTQAQWKAVTGTGTHWPWSSTYGLGDNYSAYYFSWNDCQTFVTALNTHLSGTGQGGHVRLPSEAEWEYACRAGTTTRFFFGDSLTKPDSEVDAPTDSAAYPGNRSDYMWYRFSMDSPFGSKPVKTKLPNAWGLHDMSGNEWEWCQDWYHENYMGAPNNGSAWDAQRPTSYAGRVIRGGGWWDGCSYCRSAYRTSNNPDIWYENIGFRVVLTH